MKRKAVSLKPLILHKQIHRPIDWNKIFGRKNPLDVEIGFGNGEYLLRHSIGNQSRNFVGIEQHWDGIYKTLKQIEKETIDNVRILRVDAWIAFERLLTPSSVENIYCLFPCPWPKSSHEKHRLFSCDFLKLLNSRLRKNGTLKVVTDFGPFKKWILGQAAETGFDLDVKEIPAKYNTKYERKWQSEGQQAFYELNFVKSEHVPVPLKEDAILKTYYIDNFDAENFSFQNATGNLSVVFKGLVNDEKRKKTIVHLIVAEDNITQHVWVAIECRNERWSIAPADGCGFIPTKGIAKALDMVHKECLKSSQVLKS